MSVENNIPNGWVETTLGEVANIEMGQSPKSEFYNFEGTGLPFYQGVTEFNDKYVSIKNFTSKSTKVVKENSILFSVRAPVGRVNFTKNKCCIGRGNAGLFMKNDNQNFLYFLLKYIERKIQDYSSGTVFTAISGKELKIIPIIIPQDITEQTAIAKILTAFDDKIELLQAQNKTLETTAQTIFKEWFGKYQIGDELPEGWRVGKLSEIAEFLNGLALQKFPPVSGEKTFPVIKIRELKQGITSNTDKANTSLDKKYIINNGDVLFSWSGSLDVVIWQFGKGALNQHLFKVTSENYPKWFYYFWLLHHLREFRGVASDKATTMGHINRKHLDLAEVIIPNKKSFKELNNLFIPLIEKMGNNAQQIQTLKQTRDTLLPKLMSGALRVDEFKENAV